MAENGVMDKHREPSEAVSRGPDDSPHELLFPCVDRLEALKELMSPPMIDEFELSADGRRGLVYMIGDIIDKLNGAADGIESEFVNLKKHGAPAGRLQAQNGKGSPDACGQASARLNLAKAGGGVN